MKKKTIILILCAFTMILAGPLIADLAAQEREAAGPPLRKEIIRLKYITATEVEPIVRMFLDHREGEMVGSTPDRKILTVSARPETFAKILEIIEELDVKPADILFTVQLILGWEEGPAGEKTLQNDPIIRELRGLLKYQNYSLLDTSLVRALDNSRSEVRMGKEADFELRILPRVIKDEKATLIQMDVNLRQFIKAASPPNITPLTANTTTKDLIRSTLSLKSGDKTVVGVSKLDGGGFGLILIISGTIVD